MNARRRIMPLAAIALLQLAWGRPPLAAPKADAWTPERVRAFVLKVEREMDALVFREGETRVHLDGSCWGTIISRGIKKSVVLPRVLAYLDGPVAACYVRTYLGCDHLGQWIGMPGNSYGPLRKPFKRSKVTIVEQTADHVVADVTEVSYEHYFDGDAKELVGEDHVEPFTEAEVAAVKDSSRYTITLYRDLVWRISDRKPSFPWVCTNWPDEVPPGLY